MWCWKSSGEPRECACAIDGVILTRHVGRADVSIHVQMAKLVAQNILVVLDGKPMVTPIYLCDKLARHDCICEINNSVMNVPVR
ncbi:hypothetical protein AVEN_69474-1 [Araneus ventricosus]|uniref:Uncharacterized protein n=1 Tax=Araneus ventricosus TaxID=182803 RepID=A0A4Y2IAM6_ARAVE|nr:hypothetical protein AVEN_69474-1 [Araneus ventricosus]